MKTARKSRLAILVGVLVSPLVAAVLATTPAAAVAGADGHSEVYALFLNDGGTVAAHELNGATSYTSFGAQTRTPLPAPGAGRSNWVYKFADFNGDRVVDLFAINKNDNGSTAVHVLNGASNFQNYLIQTLTPLGAATDPVWQFDVGDYNADGRADVFAINRNDGGRTAVHVLDAASNFQVFSMHTLSALGETTNPVWELGVADFNADRVADLYAVYKNDNGRTAVHVLDGDSAFQVFAIHTLLPLAAAMDPNWQFDQGDYNGDGRADLYAIYKNDQGRTAVHVLDAGSNFQIFTLHTLTALQHTDDPIWDLEVGVEGTGAVVASTGAEFARQLRGAPGKKNVNPFTITKYQTFPERGRCLKYVITGDLVYNALKYSRYDGVPPTYNYELFAPRVVAPTMDVASYQYDSVTHGCSTTPLPWTKIQMTNSYKGYGCNFNPRIGVSVISGLPPALSVGLTFWPDCGNRDAARFGATFGPNTRKGVDSNDTASFDPQMLIGYETGGPIGTYHCYQTMVDGWIDPGGQAHQFDFSSGVLKICPDHPQFSTN